MLLKKEEIISGWRCPKLKGSEWEGREEQDNFPPWLYFFLSCDFFFPFVSFYICKYELVNTQNVRM